MMEAIRMRAAETTTFSALFQKSKPQKNLGEFFAEIQEVVIFELFGNPLDCGSCGRANCKVECTPRSAPRKFYRGGGQSQEGFCCFVSSPGSVEVSLGFHPYGQVSSF